MKISQWNGDKSLWVRIGRLFFGGSIRTKSAYLIYHGKKHHYQLQTWDKKFRHWETEERK